VRNLLHKFPCLCEAMSRNNKQNSLGMTSDSDIVPKELLFIMECDSPHLAETGIPGPNHSCTAFPVTCTGEISFEIKNE
ncbi:MAG: hypothetical protein IJ216_04920, partial [Acidaminococcaceae bacterium]|nr:hypothetical protein [Acidaminococcaceae bacterium]